MIVTFQPPPHLTMQLAGTAAPGAGRRAAAALLASATTDLRNGALLIVSELVTNAVEAADECTMSAWFLPDVGAMRIEVTDSSENLPVLRAAHDGRVGGFGLRIVDHISTRWGVIEHQVGKTVWSEIAPTEMPTPHP